MVYTGYEGVAGEWEEGKDGGLGVYGVVELGDCRLRSAEVVEPECVLDNGSSGGKRRDDCLAIPSHHPLRNTSPLALAPVEPPGRGLIAQTEALCMSAQSCAENSLTGSCVSPEGVIA